MLSLFELTSLLLFLCATFGFVNRAVLHLPNSIGLLVLGTLASLVLVAFQLILPDVRVSDGVEAALRQIDLGQVIFNGMLAFLLFAGALHVNLATLRRRAAAVAYLAVFATILSTVIVGMLFWLATQWLGTPVPLPWAMVFGALISPTDPVGVLSLLKGLPISEELQVEAEGEALFNDGVGVVLFVLLIGIASGTEEFSWSGLALDFVREAGGGIVLGLATGYLAYLAMRQIDDFPVEVLITLALVTVTYAVAQRLGLSGPIATVAAGLLIGNKAPEDAMSDQTARYVSALWTLIDEILNAVLFLLIGLEVVLLDGPRAFVTIGLLTIPIVLVARLASVALPVALRLSSRLQRAKILFLTWAAIRGGISVALALSLPATDAKSPILGATYAVVLFSIVVQGLTLKPVAKLLGIAPAPADTV